MQSQSLICRTLSSSISQRIQHYIRPSLCVLAGLITAQTLYAKNLSYAEAEQQYLGSSYSGMAHQALQQAAELEAQAVKNLGMPRVDLNVRAYAFQSKVDVPLDSFKNNIENSLSNSINQNVDQWPNLPDDMKGPIKEQLQQGFGW